MSYEFQDPKGLDAATLEEGTVFAPRFDTAGLITVVTTEAKTDVLLMVAHMNAQALALTLDTGVVHYYSRSRGKIWKKGETSGELQRLVEMRTDCDQDVLHLTVRQTGRGAACHTGRKSCFFRRVEKAGDEIVLVDAGEARLFDPSEVYD